MQCPECGSQRTWKDGVRYNASREVQRYLCRSCGYRFSGFKQNCIPQLQVKKYITFQPFKKLYSRPDFAQIPICHSDSTTKKALNDSSFSTCEDVSPHNDPSKSTVGKTINAFASTIVNAKVCASEAKAAKNLVKVETVKTGLSTAATSEQAQINGLVIQFLWFLKKENYAKLTIKRYVNDLKLLAKRGANLLDPESVKMIIANQKWCDNRKIKVYYVYDAFVRMLGKNWNMPRLRAQQKLGFCPTERTVQQAIAGFGKKISIMIQLIAETGVRAGEANNLEWTQINFKTATITVVPEKGSNPTVKKVSRELLGRIQTLSRTSKKVFGIRNPNTMITNLRQQRLRLAKKLGNPELLRLTFVSIRHYYGTKLYHRGKTLLEIQRIMGHKLFTSTIQYINYDKIIFGDDDEWICKVAETSEDRKNLIEAGFQFVEQVENLSYYRKRKTGV